MSSNAAEKFPDITDSRETYRDELNFAEFPLALLDRPREGQKTIEFSDTIFDHGRKAPVTRKLTISASDKYGLPTPRDEEVILGLIQLSHQGRFADRKVAFTKGELVRLLGWSDDGKSYQRISEALNKWAGVTLYWEKSWWSKEEQCWVDETFHILDNVTLYDRERYVRKLEQSGGDGAAAMSSFVWNEVVFASFKSGYIKQLDLDFYKSLGTAIAKKMFRFLDKRFYRTRRLEFDLQTFAFEHIGLSRNYHNGEIKRKLRGAIRELEEKGFLEPLSDAERFTKRERGSWSVLFVRKASGRLETGTGNESEVGEELVKRGVGSKVARELAAAFPAEKIKEKLRLHDRLTETTDKRISKNPAGFLVAAIRDDFSVRPEAEKAPARRIEASLSPAPSRAAAKRDEEDALAFKDFSAWWESMSSDAKEKFENEAVLAALAADNFTFRQYEDEKDRAGKLFQAARLNILCAHFRRTKN